MATVQRFVDAIVAVAPLHTLSGVTLSEVTRQGTVEQGKVSFVLGASATPEQIAAANAAVAAFDWSPAADRAYVLNAVRVVMATQLGSDEAQLLRAVAYVILDEINLIRSLLTPPQSARTPAQVRTAVLNKLQSGGAYS